MGLILETVLNPRLPLLLFSFFLFFLLHQVVVAACGIFRCSMQTVSWGIWDLVP